MLMFIFGIIGLFVIIALFSFFEDFTNNFIECILGILAIFVFYALIKGILELFFEAGYQFGGLGILLMILIIVVIAILIIFLGTRGRLTKKRNHFKNPETSTHNSEQWKNCPRCGKRVPVNSTICSFCKEKI